MTRNKKQMSRIAYVDGSYVPKSQAAVSIEDRGFQFADAVYEVWSVFGGRLADLDGHLARLERSLRELSIPVPMGRGALLTILKEVIRRNKINDGMVYLQVSRGVAPRDHFFPEYAVPTVVITAKPVDFGAAARKAEVGIKVISLPDNRWGRCDIKTVGLLANCMAKEEAKIKGASEVFYYDQDGFVTEGGSSNAYMITQDGVILTRSLEANILGGITRLNIIGIAKDLGMEVREQAFGIDEVKSAREVFVTAATALVMPVVQVDESVIGNGTPGDFVTRLRAAYIEKAIKTAI
jgi:D-alanine transaminase